MTLIVNAPVIFKDCAPCEEGNISKTDWAEFAYILRLSSLLQIIESNTDRSAACVFLLVIRSDRLTILCRSRLTCVISFVSFLFTCLYCFIILYAGLRACYLIKNEQCKSDICNISPTPCIYAPLMGLILGIL